VTSERPTDPIRVLIADDHTFYREGVRALLGAVPGVEVVGEAATGDEVIAQAEALQPDVILMDLKMPGTNGVEATRRILHTSPHVGVLVVTMYEDDDSVFAAMRAGARGYLLKDADRDDLLRAIQAVNRGEAIFSPAIARRLMRYFYELRAGSPGAPTPPFPHLTNREREVLTLIAQGRNNTAIAAWLGLSLKTVQNHVSNIFSKLQVADRAQAIIRAREAGLR
jgi:DNA-binding NarL/FixJ family response regulator